MKKTMFIAALLALSAGSVQASYIPPGAVTVMTTCGKPVVAYVSTHAGIQAFYGAPLAELARKTPYNLRIETGCRQ